MISANGWRYQLTSQQAWSGGHCISRNSHVGNYPTWQRQGVKRATIFYPIQTTFHKFNGLHSPKSCWNHIETISPRPETMLGVSWEAPTWTTLCPSQGREIQHHIDAIDLPVSLVHPGRSPRVVAEALPNFPEILQGVELPTPTKMLAAKCRLRRCIPGYMVQGIYQKSYDFRKKRGPSLQTIPPYHAETVRLSAQYPTLSHKRWFPTLLYAAKRIVLHTSLGETWNTTFPKEENTMKYTLYIYIQ